MEIEITYLGATLTCSGSVEYEPKEFILEEVRCGDQDISEIVEPGSNHWLAIQTICNEPEEQEYDGYAPVDAPRRGSREFMLEERGVPPFY